LDTKSINPKRCLRGNRKSRNSSLNKHLIKIGSELLWLWVAIELVSKEILGIQREKYAPS
jgi:hypothetical protein